MVRVRRGSVVSAPVRFPPGSPPVGSSSMKMTAHVHSCNHMFQYTRRDFLVKYGRETSTGYKHCHPGRFFAVLYTRTVHFLSSICSECI
jgi:hypothetical protein